MGVSCCNTTPVFEGLSPDYKRRLWIVIGINAAMFIVEILAGALAGSRALQADALDFFADAATYGISLAVIGAPLAIRAKAAFAKGLSLTVMSLWVFGSTAYHVLVVGIPHAEVMGAVGMLALAANVASVLILASYKDGDANVRSVWLCSRNDAIGNVAVMARCDCGLVDADEMAGPDRGRRHGRAVPHLVGADPAAVMVRASLREGVRASLREGV